MRLLFVCIFLFVSVSVKADPQISITDGNSLAEGLALFDKELNHDELTATEKMAAAVAAGYIAGFIGACETWELVDQKVPFQIPKGMTVHQFAKIVQKLLTEHPEDLHQPADSMCFIALAKSFPNPASKSSN